MPRDIVLTVSIETFPARAVVAVDAAGCRLVGSPRCRLVRAEGLFCDFTYTARCERQFPVSTQRSSV